MEVKETLKRKSRKRRQDLEELGNQLATALRKGSMFSVHELLHRGASPNFRDSATACTCLEIACTSSKPEACVVIRALLSAGADPSIGSPALLAAEAGNFAAVAIILRHPQQFDCTATLYGGMTLLHQLCGSPCPIAKLPDLLVCLRLVLDRDDAPVNQPDALGMTPVMHAIEMYFEDRLNIILRHEKHRVCLDFVLPTTGTTAREVLLKRFSEFKDILPPPIMEDLNSPDPHERLLAALQLNKLDVFEQLLREKDGNGHSLVDPNHWYKEPYSSTCLEAACRMRGSEHFVKALLDAGADPKYQAAENNRSFLTYVVSTCNYATLRVLLESGRVCVSDVGSYNVSALHMAVMQQRVSKEDIEDTSKCVQLVLDELKRAWDAGRRDPTLHIDHQDANGNTALHYAAVYGNKQTTLMLLRNGASLVVKNNCGQLALSVVNPAVLKTYLDELIDCNRFSPKNGFDAIIFDYDFLFPRMKSETQEIKSEIEPLMCLTEPRMRHLIQHPVIFSFLYLKWFQIHHLFTLDILSYFLFMISLNLFIFFSKSPGEVRKYEQIRVVCCNDSFQEDLKVDNSSTFVEGNDTISCDIDCNVLSPNDELHGLGVFLVVYIVNLFVKEILNMRFMRWKYMLSFTNVCMLAVLSLSAALIGANWMANDIFKHVAAIVILLSWVQFILLSGRLPILSIQLEMVEKVAKTFFKFMVWYSLILISFSLCFHSMFRESVADEFFQDPMMSLVRTVTMFAGEFTLNTVPFVEVPVTSQIVYILFILLVAIVLLNLLNGLAVHDTQAIKANAVELSSVSLVRLVAGFEQSLVNSMNSRILAKLKLGWLVPDPRVWHRSQRRKILVFPNEKRAIKFYMDQENTRRFRRCLLPEHIVKDATDIITERDNLADMELARAMFRETSRQMVHIIKTCEQNNRVLDSVKLRLDNLGNASK